MLTGNRTYLALALLVIHQILKLAGIDVTDANLSTTVDTLLLVGAAIFRYLATKKPTV